MQLGSLHDDCASVHVFPHPASCPLCAWPMGCWAACAHAHVSCVRVCNQHTCVPTCGQVLNVCSRHVTAAPPQLGSQLPSTAKADWASQPQPLPPHRCQPFPCTWGERMHRISCSPAEAFLATFSTSVGSASGLDPVRPTLTEHSLQIVLVCSVFTCQHSQAATRPRSPRSTARR